jgi:hypothetical protein
MSTPRKDRIAFRPSLGGAKLEERLVLSNAPAAMSTMASTFFTPRVTGNSMVSQVESAFLKQLSVATNGLRQQLNLQVQQLFANGRPTQQSLTNFRNFTRGAVDALALGLSSQAALLPGSSSRLVGPLQTGLLGSGTNSLSSRLQQIVQSSATNSSPAALQRAFSVAINGANALGEAQLRNFFRTTNVNALSVNQTGQQIPLQQFMGQQLVNQIGNTLGSLAQGFPTVANSVLFPNGTTTATPAAMTAFQNLSNPALGTAAFQLSNALALFPTAANSVMPQLQSALFSNSTSLFNQLQGLPNTQAAFNTAASTAFSNSFANIVNPLNTFFGLPTQQNPILPTGQIPSPFLGTLNVLGNGFNNGFGSGFPGFGQVPTGVTPSFGLGFNQIAGNNGFLPPA